MTQYQLFDAGADMLAVYGLDRSCAKQTIIANHYSHSFPSGKSHVYTGRSAIVVFSIPANRFAGRVVLGRDANVWELTRLWAPNDHAPNLLTWAIAKAVRLFRAQEPTVEAIVSYADPNVGHEGFVYRAASWTYCGQSDESRYYQKDGQVVARRKFHSGSKCLTKKEIIALGYQELRLPGKHRYAFGLTKTARRDILLKISSNNHPEENP